MCNIVPILNKFKFVADASCPRSQNDALNNIVNAERRGKRQVLIRPSSKVIVKFLSVMQRHGQLHLQCFGQVSINTISGVITTRSGRAVLFSRHSLRVLMLRNIKASLPDDQHHRQLLREIFPFRGDSVGAGHPLHDMPTYLPVY
jgi:hypothetical protein